LYVRSILVWGNEDDGSSDAIGLFVVGDGLPTTTNRPNPNTITSGMG